MLATTIVFPIIYPQGAVEVVVVDEELVELVELELELVVVEEEELELLEVVVVVRSALYGPLGAIGSHLEVPLLYFKTSPSAIPETFVSSSPPIFSNVLFNNIVSLFQYGWIASP